MSLHGGFHLDAVGGFLLVQHVVHMRRHVVRVVVDWRCQGRGRYRHGWSHRLWGQHLRWRHHLTARHQVLPEEVQRELAVHFSGADLGLDEAWVHDGWDLLATPLVRVTALQWGLKRGFVSQQSSV